MRFRWYEYQWKKWISSITPISSVIKRNKIELRPLPGLPVIRDLVVDMTEFYAQYEKIKPFLQNEDDYITEKANEVLKFYH